MALEEVGMDLGALGAQLITEIFERFAWLTGLIRAVGIFVIIYIIYLIIKVFRDMKMRSRIAKIDKKVDILEEKIDKLILKEEGKNKKEKPKSRRKK
jgi:uncharacterized membrane protein YcjF (UPF0283 family)